MSKGNPKSQQHISDNVKKAFKEMDKDGNGKVTFSEFRDFCKRVPGMEGVSECFCEIDTSDDCQITLDELNALCQKLPKEKINECHIKDVFRQLDKSGDGKLDKNEFRALMCQCGYKDDVISETFNHIAGGDGQITLKEFLDAFNQG